MTLTGLAGCTASVGLGGSRSVEDWLVDPVRLPGRPEHPEVYSIAPSSIEEYADDLPREDWHAIRDDVADQYDFTRLHAEDVDRIVSVAGGYRQTGYDVIAGDLDRDQIADDLEREDYRSRDEHEGFDLYESDDGPTAAGVADETLVLASDPVDDNPLFVVEDVINAAEGEEQRMADVDADFETLLDALRVGDLSFFRTREPVEETNVEWGEFRNQVGGGLTIDLGADDSEIALVVPFLDERDPREQDIEDWVQEADTFRLWRDVDIEIDGAVARVEGDVPTRDVFDEFNL